MIEWWAWLAFVLFILAMLAVDLFWFHREAHAVSMREAATWSGVWMGLGVSFGVLLWIWQGGETAGAYITGYLIEKSLSVDNIFVFALLFSYFAVPKEYQHKLLFWGVVGALVFRAGFIAGGAALLKNFHWTIYLFGAFLVFTGIKMARHTAAHVDPSRNPVLRAVARFVPMETRYHGGAFFVRKDGRRWATPLLAALVAVETTDIIFAVDSIPAIFAITTDTFVVFTSNAFAILGLRALYFLLAGMIERFVYLKAGLAAILVMVGAKMLATDFVKVPGWMSLTLIASILGASVYASLRAKPAPAAEPAVLDETSGERVD